MADCPSRLNEWGHLTMNHLDTDREVLKTDAKPLFASVWLALYSELRKNYTERQLAGNKIAGKPQAFPKKQAGSNLGQF